MFKFEKGEGKKGSLGIAPTFLKLDSWAGFIPIICHIHQGNISDKERKIVRKS